MDFYAIVVAHGVNHVTCFVGGLLKGCRLDQKWVSTQKGRLCDELR